MLIQHLFQPFERLRVESQTKVSKQAMIMCCIRTFVGFQVSICNAATLDQKLMVLLKMLLGVLCSENATQTIKGGIYSVYSASP